MQRATAAFITMVGSRLWFIVNRGSRNHGSGIFRKTYGNYTTWTEDFGLANDMAAQYPEKVKEMQDLFLAEAIKNNVLPLDDRAFERSKPRWLQDALT